MATPEVLNSLTETIQDCITVKMQEGFERNSQLTVDIANEIIEAMEHKINTYTDIEITELKQFITNNEVDLDPFIAFMEEIRNLLDGDPLTAGFQIWDVLVADSTYVKNELITHASTLSTIQQTITTVQTTIADHETRIAALEAAQQEPTDCEDCHDELLNLLKGSIQEACTGASVTVNAYHEAEEPKYKREAVNAVNSYDIVLSTIRAWRLSFSIAGDVTGIPELRLVLTKANFTDPSGVIDTIRFIGSEGVYEYANDGNDTYRVLHSLQGNAVGDYFRGIYTPSNSYIVEFLKGDKVVYYYDLDTVTISPVLTPDASHFNNVNDFELGPTDTGNYVGSFNHALGSVPEVNGVSKLTFLMANGTEVEHIPNITYDAQTTIESVDFNFQSPGLEATGLYVHRIDGTVISYHILDLNV